MEGKGLEPIMNAQHQPNYVLQMLPEFNYRLVQHLTVEKDLYE